MKWLGLGLLGLVGVGIVLAIFLFVAGVKWHNVETGQRNLITAKQTDNKNEMDAMWKIIEQNAQVTTEQKNALVEIFNGYANGRTVEGQGRMMAWIKEVVPDASPTSKAYLVLMNTITAQREGFKFRQKELLDMKRVHDDILTKFPGVVFATILGRHKIDVVIVTSTRTENAFKSGKDDETDLFKKNTAPASTNK
jgi:hypothetical protein